MGQEMSCICTEVDLTEKPNEEDAPKKQMDLRKSSILLSKHLEVKKITKEKKKQLSQLDESDEENDSEYFKNQSLNQLFRKKREQIIEKQLEIDEFVVNIKDLINQVPVFTNHLNQFQRTLEVILYQSESADDDYYERKAEIKERLDKLQEMKKLVKRQQKQFILLNNEQKHLIQMIMFTVKQKQKNNYYTSDTENLDQLHEQMVQLQENLGNLLGEILDTQDELYYQRQEIGDCDIQIIIEKRKQEMIQFSGNFDRLKNEFHYLQETLEEQQDEQDQWFLGMKKEDLQKFERQIREAELQLNLIENHKNILHKNLYKEIECLDDQVYEDYSVNFEIIQSLRKIKQELVSGSQKLKEIQINQDQILNQIIQKDLKNSQELIKFKVQSFLERLKKQLQNQIKIEQSGTHIDGNTSCIEEDEVVLNVNSNIPEIKMEINQNFQMLTDIDILLKQLQENLSSDQLDELINKISIASQSIDQIESKNLNLEKQIFQLNFFKKMCKRLFELEETKQMCKNFLHELNKEKRDLENELEKNQIKQEQYRGKMNIDKNLQFVDIKKELENQQDQMKEYLSEIILYNYEVNEYQVQNQKISINFIQQVPKTILDKIKKDNFKSAKEKSQGSFILLNNFVEDKNKSFVKLDNLNEIQTENYKMIELNFKIRKSIKELQENLRIFQQKRNDLDEKYEKLRKDIFEIDQIQPYKLNSRKIDVDEVFSRFLKKHKLTSEVQKISEGKYIWNQNKILVRMINERLIIRVGGGYMNVEDFVKQKTKIEIARQIKNDEAKKKAINENDSRDIQSSLTTTGDAKSKNGNRAIKEKTSMYISESVRKTDPYDVQTTNKSIKKPITDKRLGNVNFSQGINRFEIESNMSSQDFRKSRNRDISNKPSSLGRSAVRQSQVVYSQKSKQYY